MEKSEENNLKEKLEYLNLDLENIPDFLYKYQPLEFRAANGVYDNEQIVYKHIPINKIQILITPTTKNAELKVKYAGGLALHKYIDMNDAENVERYTVFLNMLNLMEIDEVEEIEKTQRKLNEAIPFRVRYQKSYKWQIYYSQVSDIYFMLVPVEDLEYNYMFYLLKKQIEYMNYEEENIPKIYVPVNYLDYSREIYNRAELKDVENYLWLLTGTWVNIYEVYNRNNESSIHILGVAKVYDDVKAEFKVELSNKEDANNFYKLIKALFILKTELNQFYKFDVRINENSELEFYYNSEKLTLDTIPDFIKREYKIISDELIRKNLSSNYLEQVLTIVKKDCLKKEKEFLEKERQISTFLEYKRTFFGKIKIFFSNKKKKTNDKKEKDEEKEEVQEVKPAEVSNAEVLEEIVETKHNYTIEDLVIVYSLYDKKEKHVKDLNMDIKAMNHRIKNLDRKIENATIYIKEIEKHKKSIFEFWKFANKDELPALAEGELMPENKKLNKAFNYEFDFEDLGNKIDKKQRDKLSKDEINSVFLTRTNVLKGINIIRKEEITKEDEDALSVLLEELKQDLDNEKYNAIDFDIFGSMLEDKTQIKTIANKHHRETEKNKYQILNVSKNTTIDEFYSILKSINENINQAIKKIKFIYDMPVYKTMPSTITELEKLNVFSINAVSSMEKNNNADINLYKINIKTGEDALFYTNIIFFDNYNKTLPIGMNLSNDVLLDFDNLRLQLKSKKIFMTNLYSNNDEDAIKLEVIKVNVIEYDCMENLVVPDPE